MSGRVKLAVFDMDGVIVDAHSSWVLVHRHFGTSNEDSLEAFMRDEIDDLEFIRRDVERWIESAGDVTMREVEEVLERAPIVEGAMDTLKDLDRSGVRTAIVSGGLIGLADRVARAGNVSHVRANDVEVDGRGLLTGGGHVNVPLKDKDTIVRELQGLEGVGEEETAVVGNSEVDIPMFELAGLSIAFNPLDSRTAEAADHVVVSRDLRDVLPLILGPTNRPWR